ncbi:MAG: hypothetical protein H7Y31_03840 [Chitinophagaceae bacterium]|nr:hypothetical protein [Chitinophagaceae bacterium]
MFSIFKKRSQSENNLAALGTDMHSHLLPGIDDGSPDSETSLQLMRGMIELGISRFITTPHIYWDLYKNDPGTIGAAHSTLNDALATERIDTPIRAAAEYFMDDHFDRLINSKAPLLTISGNMVLVEFSFVSPPANFKNQLFNLQINGYQPVLAHPERYMYLTGSKNVFDDLKDAGCLFQVNLLSLAGYYGKPPADLANYLIKRQYVELLGTDLHHFRHLDALRFSPQLMSPVNGLLDSGRLLNSKL